MEEKLAEKLGDGLEDGIAGEIAGFGGLLTRHAAILLLCRKNGIDVETKISLSQAGAFRLPFSFEAKIERIFPAQSYRGRPDRSIRLHVRDDSAQATLVLWNDYVEMADRGGLCAGDGIECHGAYMRSGEITLAKGGSATRKKEAQILRIRELQPGICSVKGTASEIGQEMGLQNARDAMIDGGTGARLSFTLCESQGECVQVLVWAGQDMVRELSEDDNVILENVVFKNKALHFSSFSRLVRLGGASADESTVLECVDAGADETVFTLGGRKFTLKNEDAMAILGMQKTVPGVSAKAAIMIKAQGIAGKPAAFRAEGGKLCSLSF